MRDSTRSTWRRKSTFCGGEQHVQRPCGQKRLGIWEDSETTERLCGVTEIQEGVAREAGGDWASQGPLVTGRCVDFTLRAIGAKESVGEEGTWNVNCKNNCELVPSILWFQAFYRLTHVTLPIPLHR